MYVADIIYEYYLNTLLYTVTICQNISTTYSPIC